MAIARRGFALNPRAWINWHSLSQKMSRLTSRLRRTKANKRRLTASRPNTSIAANHCLIIWNDRMKCCLPERNAVGPCVRSLKILPKNWHTSPDVLSCVGSSAHALPALAVIPSRRPPLPNRHAPCGSHQMIFSRSLRRPRKTNRWPEYRSSLSTFLACAANVLNPRCMSVTPAAKQTRVLLGIGPDSRLSLWYKPRQWCFDCLQR